MSTIPSGFQSVVPAPRPGRPAESDLGFSIQRNGAVFLSSQMRTHMPPARFPSIEIAVNQTTHEVYIGPVLDNRTTGVFTNPKKGQIMAKTLVTLLDRLGFERGAFYRVTALGNGYVASPRTKRV